MQITPVRLLCCRTTLTEIDATVLSTLRTAGHPVAEGDLVGPRPGKAIDPLLTGPVVVIGDDADLAAVVLRLLRKDLLSTVEVGFVPLTAGTVARRFSLATGAAAVSTALTASARPVVLVRDDVGGVLLAEGRITPVGGPVYVDEYRLADVPTPELVVVPDEERGVRVTATRKRFLGLGRSGTTLVGRATQIAGPAMQVQRDGVPFARQMDRWTWYRHTQPLLFRAGTR